MNQYQHSPPVTPEKSTPAFAFMCGKPMLFLLLGGFFSALTVQLILENLSLAQSFLSPTTWQSVVVNIFGGELLTEESLTGQAQVHSALVPFWICLLAVYLFQIMLTAGLFLSSSSLSAARGMQLWHERMQSLNRLAGWWCALGGWGIAWLMTLVFGWESAASLLQGTVPFWISLTLAGSFYEISRFWIPSRMESETLKTGATEDSSNSAYRWLALAIFLYVLVFTAMNWGLWFNLRLPHGDAAMYEEHLWNVLHGKGFRSYLDQGLFWGEHIQFVHLFLLPVYLLWPSHLTLELCQSLALALGAIPVFWLARRASGSDRAGWLLSVAYLVYFPLQFLDISIDLKSFRPMAFSIPIVLFALDQLERQRYRTATLLLLFSLTCKEDLSISLFSVGLVLLAQTAWSVIQQRSGSAAAIISSGNPPVSDNRWKYGLFYLMFAPVYLLSALRLIRWFRSGVEVHYAGYFTKFGDSTSEIIWNMLTNPGLLLGELFVPSTLIYALAILVPLGFLPLLSPLRLLGCLPMFVLLCLNELASDPRHHFHAPLVPLVFWAAAGGLGTLFNKRHAENTETPVSRADVSVKRANWAVCCGLATSLWFSMSPLGVPFWDPGSSWNGLRLYWPDERARMFEKIQDLIPREARVASTDYVHPRYTHHERSYDYSQYARKISGYELKVPDDTDYIVIDTRHPYSTIQSVEQTREIQQEPENWEILPDQTRGYFIVLKRKRPEDISESQP